jgi:hypothetical protein
MAVEELGLLITVKGLGVLVSDMKKADTIIDKTARAWSSVDKASSKAMGSVRALAKQMQDLAKSTKATLQELQPVGVALGVVSAAGVKAATSSALTASRTEELSLVLDVLAKNAREAAIAEGDYTKATSLSEKAIDSAVASIKEKGITTQVANKLTAQFVRYELDMAQSTELARVAQDAAVLSMEDSSTALDGLLHGILTYNPVVLRTYGISVLAKDAFEDFAAETGVLKEEMTSAQKAQAMLNAVLKEGGSIAGAYDAAMGSAGKRMRSMSRHWEEAKNALGKHFLPVMVKAVDTATDMLKAFNNLDPSTQKTIASFIGVGTVITAALSSFILIVPRVISLTQSLGALAPALRTVTTGFQLMTEGAMAGETASLGLGSAIGAVAIPLAALVGIVLAANTALEGHHEKTIAVSESYIQYVDMMQKTGRAAQILTEEEYKLAQSEEVVTERAVGWTSAIQETAGRLDMMAAATRGATGANEELEESMRDVATTFGEEIDFDNESLWDMARASGAGYEELEQLAKELGIASEAEIQLALKTAALNAGLGEGLITVEEYLEGMNALATEELVAAEQAAIAAGEVEVLHGGIVEATEPTIKFSDRMSVLSDTELDAGESADTLTAALRDVAEKEAIATAETESAEAAILALKDGMEETSGKADTLTTDVDELAAAEVTATEEAEALAKALDAIPKEIVIVIRYEEEGTPPAGYQHGTSYFKGGAALVGEAGPEVVVLPEGSKIIPNSEITNNTYNYNLSTSSMASEGSMAMEFADMAMATR